MTSKKHKPNIAPRIDKSLIWIHGANGAGNEDDAVADEGLPRRLPRRGEVAESGAPVSRLKNLARRRDDAGATGAQKLNDDVSDPRRPCSSRTTECLSFIFITESDESAWARGMNPERKRKGA